MYLFIDFLDPIEMVNLVEGDQKLYDRDVFWNSSYFFRVDMKCVQKAVTVVLGAKASATRQPMK